MSLKPFWARRAEGISKFQRVCRCGTVVAWSQCSAAAQCCCSRNVKRPRPRVGLDGVGIVELGRDEFSIYRDDGRRAAVIALSTALHD